ncbi:hypothetical protein [Mesorhizobium sp. M0701]|uniref:hypothetical protein n=1 Tax=unclassified Mesorhizobium TaxID=325217 RepID=UPI00333BDE58
MREPFDGNHGKKACARQGQGNTIKSHSSENQRRPGSGGPLQGCGKAQLWQGGAEKGDACRGQSRCTQAQKIGKQQRIDRRQRNAHC